MGLTISYYGMFNKKLSLKDMILEAIDFAKKHQWQTVTFEDEFPDSSGNNDSSRYGLIVTPPGSDPVHLHFDSTGRLGFEMSFSGDGEEELEVADSDDIFDFGCFAFTKTQFAGPEVHIKVVELLRSISDKYLHDFKVHDDGGYWSTGDERHLRDRFDTYNGILSELKAKFEQEGLKFEEGSKMIFNKSTS